MAYSRKAVRRLRARYGKYLRKLSAARKEGYLARWNSLSEEQKAKYTKYLKRLGEARARMSDEQKARFLRLRRYWRKKVG